MEWILQWNPLLIFPSRHWSCIPLRPLFPQFASSYADLSFALPSDGRFFRTPLFFGRSPLQIPELICCGITDASSEVLCTSFFDRVLQILLAPFLSLAPPKFSVGPKNQFSFAERLRFWATIVSFLASFPSFHGQVCLSFVLRLCPFPLELFNLRRRKNEFLVNLIKKVHPSGSSYSPSCFFF